MNGTYVDYWAVVTRGLEPVCRDELAAHDAGAQELSTHYRRVEFRSAADPSTLLGLRTADDLFLHLAEWTRVGRPRSTLADLAEHASRIDLRDAAAICGALRELGTPPSFSVTVNFVGRRNYSTDEIKAAVGGGVEATHRWEFMPREDQADLNLRVFIEHEQAYVGLRLAQAPLHERGYKVASLPGSLKPTVAAAMIRLGAFAPAAMIVDPLCGVGTIPIEAALAGLQSAGGDQDAAALEAARQNRDQAGVAVELQAWDARALPLPAASVDGVVCNLPWGRQVAVDQAIEHFYADCLAELARILRPDGRMVLLTSLQPLLRSTAAGAGFRIDSETEISLSGQTPVISTLRPAETS